MVSQKLMFVFSCTYMGFVFSTLLFGLPPLKASGSVFEFYYWEIFPHVTPWVYPISLSAQTASAYMTLCVTIERYVAVCQVILYCNNPHLSKGPSDLVQNGTQEKTQFSGPVFHGL